MREIGILYTPDNIRAIAEKRKWQTRRIMKPQPGIGSYKGWTESLGVWRNTQSFPGQRWKSRYRVGDILYVKEAWRIGAWDENEGTVCIDYKEHCRRDWVGVPTEEEFMRLWVDCSDDCAAAGVKPDSYGNYSWKPGESPCHWRSPLYMPKWAARPELKRRVTEVRVQRVQDISEEDAIAEGIDTEGCCLCPPDKAVGVRYCIRCNKRLHDFIGEFAELWDSINSKPKSVREKGVITHYISYPWDDIHETRKHRGKPWYVCGNPFVFAYSFEEL